MKTRNVIILAILTLFAPMTMAAQQNIRQAFEGIIKCSDAKITQSRQFDKDPTTGEKTGQCDVYNFTLPASKMSLVKKVLNAFDKDISKAYSVQSGQATKSSSKITLAVGDGKGSGPVVNERGTDYIYALFLAPTSEDSKGIYRYAYAFNYRDTGSKIEGKIIITYATTLKYRQENATGTFGNIHVITSSPTNEIKISGGWFTKIMTYINSISGANSNARISLASRMYTLICNVGKYDDVTDNEKNTVRELIKTMSTDSKYSDPVLRKLLQQCLADLK